MAFATITDVLGRGAEMRLGAAIESSQGWREESGMAQNCYHRCSVRIPQSPPCSVSPSSAFCGSDSLAEKVTSCSLATAISVGDGEVFSKRVDSVSKRGRRRCTKSSARELEEVRGSFFAPMSTTAVNFVGNHNADVAMTCQNPTKIMAMSKAGGQLDCIERLSNHFCQVDPMPAIAGQGPPLPMALCQNHVPVYVVLPQDTVTAANTVNHVKALRAGLRALRKIGVDGVVMDVWWGVVEGEAPKKYDWSAYDSLLKMVSAEGLKVRASLCFHGCSSGMSNDCVMTLPRWVTKEAETNPDIFYADKGLKRYDECLSLGVDVLPIFEGRTPVQMYKDFMESFRENFADYLGSTIAEVQVGLGPAGELKYPSQPMRDNDDTWEFPGVGQFQCYDKYMLSSLKACALAAGKEEWGRRGPHDAGTYKQKNVQEIAFFEENHGSWRSDYGVFFLSWYAQALVSHGDRILGAAADVFCNNEVLISAKLPRVHWMYKTTCHAAELTAGFYNIAGRDGYESVMAMIARHGGVVNLSGVDLRDEEQRADAMASPEALLTQLRTTADKHGVCVSAENALPRYEEKSHETIKKNVHGGLGSSSDGALVLPRLLSFTFQRMGEALFQADNWRRFVLFVMQLDNVSTPQNTTKVDADRAEEWSWSSAGAVVQSADRSFDLVGFQQR